MLFSLSKVFWFFAEPGNLLIIALCLGAVLLWSRWRRAGRWLISAAALAGFAVATIPVGGWLTLTLENRFPVVRDLPPRVDGIISLGGVVNPWVTKARGQLALGGSVERLTEFAALARRYPGAKLIFAGGSGSLFDQTVKEADVLAPFLDVLGLDADRVMLENKSRNTYESALFTHALANPGPDEVWILVTTAWHMPRAFGCFRKAGWRVIPYPVDFNYKGDEQFGLSFNLRSGLSRLAGGLHEWLGLFFYWLMDRTVTVFPAPGD
jgi:uncharacterized SAM-binding protein YcdF (DUF218 family)